MADANDLGTMTFAEFAQAVLVSGAVNRQPSGSSAPDLYSYSVYMNGPIAAQLQASDREHNFKDVTLHALTEKLMLDPLSARDNLKVAELVAVRGAWMSNVLSNSLLGPVASPEVQADYSLLSEGMSHPWIQQELDAQRELSQKLGPTMARAGVVKDIVPQESTRGQIVVQDDDFTLQRNERGEVVTHENRRLQELPAVGKDVSVTYYRGTGQVVDELDKSKFSAPFLDQKTRDIALRVGDNQVVLFNSVQSFGQFITAHGLDGKLAQQAFDLRAANPKSGYQMPERTVTREPYLDSQTGGIAIDYMEQGAQYTSIFQNATALASAARQYGLGAKGVATAFRIETEGHSNGQMPLSPETLKDSEMALRGVLKAKGYGWIEKTALAGQRDYVGRIVDATDLYVAQDIGRKKVVIHDIRSLDKAPQVGDQLNIRVKDGQGVVNDILRASKDRGR